MGKYKVEETTRGRYNFYKNDAEITPQEIVDKINKIEDIVIHFDLWIDAAVEFIKKIHKDS